MTKLVKSQITPKLGRISITCLFVAIVLEGVFGNAGWLVVDFFARLIVVVSVGSALFSFAYAPEYFKSLDETNDDTGGKPDA